jgi:hypothetical protein
MPVDRDEAVVKALSDAWSAIRARNRAIPVVAWYLTSGRASSCATVSWDEDIPVVRINLRQDGENRDGQNIMQWMLHLAAHSQAPATSSEGRWHSADFGAEAERLGLDVEKTPDTGWAKTTLATHRYDSQIAALDKAMSTWEPVSVRKSNRGPVSMRCACDPPRVLRVSSGVAAAGQIRCEICGEEFVLSASAS